MPFDPACPVANSPISSAELRNQFNGLKALIDAVPAGVSEQQFSEAVNTLDMQINSVLDHANTEIAATALNPAAVDTLNINVNDPPTLADAVQIIANKLDELITALKRE